MAKLELALLVGEESKAALAQLTELVERLEKVLTATATTTAPAATTAKTTKKAAKPAAEDEQETFDLGADESEDEAEVTMPELIKACKANRETAIKVLKKLKVSSVHDLKPAQYATVMAQLGA